MKESDRLDWSGKRTFVFEVPDSALWIFGAKFGVRSPAEIEAFAIECSCKRRLSNPECARLVDMSDKQFDELLTKRAAPTDFVVGGYSGLRKVLNARKKKTRDS